MIRRLLIQLRGKITSILDFAYETAGILLQCEVIVNSVLFKVVAFPAQLIGRRYFLSETAQYFYSLNLITNVNESPVHSLPQCHSQ